ncbi:hypothetical protein MHYP_G00067470 [Metynnis hypsauchen]
MGRFLAKRSKAPRLALHMEYRPLLVRCGYYSCQLTPQLRCGAGAVLADRCRTWAECLAFNTGSSSAEPLSVNSSSIGCWSLATSSSHVTQDKCRALPPLLTDNHGSGVGKHRRCFSSTRRNDT